MSGPTPATVAGLLRSQLLFKPCLSSSISFKNQTAIVTGANAGLGREAAKHLVRLGADNVILAVRTPSKGEEARKYIEKITGRVGVMEIWQLDMSSFASVEAFAERARGLARLDVVVANAGVWPSEFALAEGHEATITVNVLATFLLIRLLLPTLNRTATQHQTTPRATIVTSTLHAFATLTARKTPNTSLLAALDDPTLLKEDYNGRYNDSKLLVQLYGSRLATSMRSSNANQALSVGELCLNFVSPGWCSSNLHPADGLGERVAEKVLTRSVDEGSRCLVDAVALEKVMGRHGAYVHDMKVMKPAPWLATKEGQETADRVWREFNEVLMPIVERNRHH